jgi:hypothetical protein
LYHTKLEQLTTLTNRLNTLARTVGREYFAQDILEPLPAPGENPSDPNVNWDVTPERFSKLEKELVRGKAEVVNDVLPSGCQALTVHPTDKTVTTAVDHICTD